jgi:flagellar basal body-associated protein FliL
MDKIHIILIIVCVVLAIVLGVLTYVILTKDKKKCPDCPVCPSFPPANFLGVKGKWDKDFKDTQNPVPGNDKCSQCIANNSEMMLTPYEYLTMNNDTKNLVLKKCEICK